MRNYLTLFFMLFSFALFAQDVIVKKDGSTILSKVYEVGEKEIKYKKFSNLNGPIYTLSVKEVMAINYENGEKDLFDKIKQKKEQPKKEALDTFCTAKKKIEMYSNFSIGYAGFGRLSIGKPLGFGYLSFLMSHGLYLGYDYGIKPIKNINLYTELGVWTFPKRDEINMTDASGVIVLEDLYLTILFPLNLKYKINIKNSDFALSPYIGIYYRCDVGRKLFEEFKINQFGWQFGLSVGYKNFSLSGFHSYNFKRNESNLYGVHFGASLGYRLDM